MHSRRALLHRGALVAAGSFLPAFARRALARSGEGDRVLVFLFLRGALDGLAAVVPYGDPRFRQLRPALAPPPPGAEAKTDQQRPLLDLGIDGFGLHAALEALLPLWRERSLAIVHAVGSPDPTRSHFDAQDALELGTPGVKSTKDGWLARGLRIAAEGRRSPIDAVAISPRMPRSLEGGVEALAFASLDQLRLRPFAGAGGREGRAEARRSFEAMYEAAPREAVATSGREAFAALALLEKKLAATSQRSPAGYPAGALGRSLRQLAQLIHADVGLRAGFADAGGWDTHANQPGQLAANLEGLGEALAAFVRDLGPKAEKVVLVAATEFGRTVRQNGANGTDHGHGSVAFVLGGKVNGGRIHGRWPGLDEHQLYEGRDLAATTDLRSVLAAAAGAQLGVRDASALFPGFAGGPLAGLFPAV